MAFGRIDDRSLNRAIRSSLTANIDVNAAQSIRRVVVIMSSWRATTYRKDEYVAVVSGEPMHVVTLIRHTDRLSNVSPLIQSWPHGHYARFVMQAFEGPCVKTALNHRM